MIITEDYKSEILSDAKMLLNITDDSADEIISFIIEDTVSMVLAYCRLQVLPYQLHGLIARIAVSVYQTCSSPDNISALAEGDRKIEYRTVSEAISGYYQRLQPFVNRRGRVPSEVSCDV